MAKITNLHCAKDEPVCYFSAHINCVYPDNGSYRTYLELETQNKELIKIAFSVPEILRIIKSQEDSTFQYQRADRKKGNI